MVRSLWSAATGMIAQQNNVDTIANNLANVNTTGYKTETNEFKSLLYQTMQTRSTSANGDQKPIGAQVGLGVRNASITSQFTQGSMLSSENCFAFALEGDGFFAVRGDDGQTYYTRNGEFNVSLGTAGLTLSDSDGHAVLGADGNPIVFPGNLISSRITADTDGRFYYPDDQNIPRAINNLQIGTWQFQNRAGLNKEGDSLYTVTAASGLALNENTNANTEHSKIVQGYLEGSNVQVADEMVNLIVAQRAYEMNSKAITTTDEMLQQANQLKR